MQVIRVPTLSELTLSYDRMFQLWEQASGDNLDVVFDFSDCEFLRQSAVAFLGGLARLIAYRGGRARFAWDTMRSGILMNLKQNGFLAAFGEPVPPWVGNSVPYREVRVLNVPCIVRHLQNLWLGRNWVHLSPALQNAIAGRVCEIYVNAFDHARSPIGVFSCGQHYPRLKTLKLTVVDFGVGIPSNVRLFLRHDSMPADAAMRWAFQRGNTTRPGRISGGVGFDLLKDLVRVNKGRLDVFSYDGHAVIMQNVEMYYTRPMSFEGTLVTITLRCDNLYYRLASESTREPLF